MTLRSGIITAVIALSLISSMGFAHQYYLGETLMLSQIIRSSDDPKASILVNLFDFDTGLTRYDIYNLARKGDYWEMRMRQVLSKQNPREREIENEKLIEEMMQDPTMKKIAREFLAIGWDLALSILGATRCVTVCCK